jgi:formylglycine-generating enzyme required for sulfatase activity
VVLVSWYEAIAFCNWLTVRLRAAGELEPGQAITLPSEAQWEKAARGGLEIPAQNPKGLTANPASQRVYPWGNEADPNRANYTDTGLGTTSAVGCFPRGASPYGCLDMSGNVDEWCQTKWQDDYQAYKDDNDPAGTLRRVVRGGAFNRTGGGVRCSVRRRYSPSRRYYGRGFRVSVGSE